METEGIVAIVGSVMAVAALGVSIWEGVQNRRHNRLSVRPLLRIDCIGMREPPISMTLINAGVGPAIVQSFRIDVDGTAIASSIMHPMGEAIKRIGLQNERHTYFTPWKGEAISPGERLPTLIFPDEAIDKAAADHIRGILPRLRIRVAYSSIYEQEFVLDGGWC